MATTKPRTIVLKRIRRQVRNAISWHRVDDGMPYFWSSENYQRAKKVVDASIGNFPYYSKSSKAIEEIAEKILKEAEQYVESNKH